MNLLRLLNLLNTCVCSVTPEKETYYYPSQGRAFQSTMRTFIDSRLLQKMDGDLLRNQSSFRGMAKSYQDFFESLAASTRKRLPKRRLHRRRLLPAWFRWTLVRWHSEKGMLNSVPLGELLPLST